MAEEYLSTDPNAGVEDQYLSTDPNAGLEPQGGVGQALKNAGEALVETVKGFIPTTPKALAEFATPVVSGVENIAKAGRTLSDVVFGGKGVNEAVSQNIPESQILAQADQTPPFSKERFAAGFGMLGNIAMGGLLLKGVGKPLLSEITGVKPVEAAPEAVPQTPEPLVSEVAAQQPITEDVTPTHTSQISTAPPDARTFIADRMLNGATREEALKEWQNAVSEHETKMRQGLPEGSQVKTADGIFELESGGLWRATESGGGKGVLLGFPEGDILRIGSGIEGKSLPTGRVQSLEGGEINAEQIQGPARADVNVQLPGGESAREVYGGEMPPNVGGEGVPQGGQGEALLKAEEVKPYVKPSGYGDRYIAKYGLDAAKERHAYLLKRAYEELGNSRMHENLIDEMDNIERAIQKQEPSFNIPGEALQQTQEVAAVPPEQIAGPSASELANPLHDLNKIRRPIGPNGEELPNGEQVGPVTMPENVEPWQMSFNDYANAENIDRRVAASLYRDSVNTAVSLGKLSGEQAVEKLGGSTPSLENNIRLRKADEAQWGHEPAPDYVEEIKPSAPVPQPEQPRIVAAAIRDADTGKTFTGPSHPQIYDKFPQIEGDPGEAFTGEGWNTGGNYIDGFVDQNGKFYDREEAASLHGLTNEASMGELESVAGKIPEAPYKILKPEPTPVSGVSESATVEPQPKSEAGASTGSVEPPAAPPPVPAEAAASDNPQVSRIANRYVEERVASGEIGEISPGQGYSTQELAAAGLKMSPEEITQHISDLVNKTGDPIKQAEAVRAEESRLSQASLQASKLAEANPNDKALQEAADEAFKNLTDFHNGPVAQAKENFHALGMSMQGELPVDLSTFNGLREQWLKDTGKPPTPEQDAIIKKQAAKVATTISEDSTSRANLRDAIDKATSRRKLPTPEEVQNNIMERMKVEPCLT